MTAVITTHLKEFERMMLAGNYCPATISNYLSCAKVFLHHFAQKPSIKHISAKEILDYLMTYENYNARKHNHSALKLFYKYVARQPLKMRFIPYGRRPQTLPRVIDKDHLVQAITAIQNKKHRAILALSFCCGLRVSEVVNIKLTDLEGGILLIRLGKGKKDRFVSYSEQVRDWLKEYWLEHRPKEYLFEGQYGGEYSVRSCQEIFKFYITRDKSFHSLRHSCFTALLEQGTDLRAIQRIAGHRSIKTTTLYCHVSKGFLQRLPKPI